MSTVLLWQVNNMHFSSKLNFSINIFSCSIMPMFSPLITFGKVSKILNMYPTQNQCVLHFHGKPSLCISNSCIHWKDKYDIRVHSIREEYIMVKFTHPVALSWAWYVQCSAMHGTVNRFLDKEQTNDFLSDFTLPTN